MNVVACREAGSTEGNVHAMSVAGTPMCGPWWDGGDFPGAWVQVSGRVTCRVCVRVLGDMPNRRKVVLAEVGAHSRKPLVHLSEKDRIAPRCGTRNAVARRYRRVEASALVTCSRCLGIALPTGGGS